MCPLQQKCTLTVAEPSIDKLTASDSPAWTVMATGSLVTLPLAGMVTNRLPLLNVTGTIDPGTIAAPPCWAPTVTAPKVVGVLLQALEICNSIDVPATATAAMSRAVAL
jgi:hypothetical protein